MSFNSLFLFYFSKVLLLLISFSHISAKLRRAALVFFGELETKFSAVSAYRVLVAATAAVGAGASGGESMKIVCLEICRKL